MELNQQRMKQYKTLLISFQCDNVTSTIANYCQLLPQRFLLKTMGTVSCAGAAAGDCIYIFGRYLS